MAVLLHRQRVQADFVFTVTRPSLGKVKRPKTDILLLIVLRQSVCSCSGSTAGMLSPCSVNTPLSTQYLWFSFACVTGHSELYFTIMEVNKIILLSSGSGAPFAFMSRFPPRLVGLDAVASGGRHGAHSCLSLQLAVFWWGVNAAS